MSLFGTRRVGVDLGATAVRVVEIAGLDSYGSAIVKRAAIVPLQEGAIVAGEIKDPLVVGRALAQAIRMAKVPRQGFVVGIGSRFTAVGRYDAPDAVQPAERTDFLRADGEPISSLFPLEEAALSWNVIHSRQEDDRIIHTLNVAGGRRSDIETIEQVCALANCQPQAVDLIGAALVRAVLRVTEDDTAISTVVDVGATRTIIVTREGFHIRSITTLPVGGIQMTRAIMGATETDFHDAEARKQRMSLTHLESGSDRPWETNLNDGFKANEAELALVKVVDALIEDIARAISDDATRYNRRMAAGVQLTGGGARIPGFAGRLSARLGIEAVVTRAHAELQYNKQTAPLFLDASEGVESAVPRELTTAIGLALWSTPQ